MKSSHEQFMDGSVSFSIADGELLQKLAALPVDQRAAAIELLLEIQSRKQDEAARESFMAFVRRMWPAFIEGAHHKKMADAFERVARGELKRVIINMPPRHDLRVDQEVPTTEGFKSVKDIQPGDYVFGVDGKPVLVVGKSPVNRKPTYAAIVSDGQTLVVSEDHLWTVRKSHRSDGGVVTNSTRELYKRQLSVNLKPKLPISGIAEYPDRNLPVPPYVMGAWLGDGASANGTMAAHPNDAAHIRARFEADGVPTTDTKWDMTFGTRGLMVRLRDAGVLGKKHIPEIYMTSSPAQRLALIQGLMDTDGDVTVDGKCTFNTSDEKMAKDFASLINSFGVKARVTSRMPKRWGKYQPKISYRVMFKMANAASLPRKAERCRAKKGNLARTITFTPTGMIEETQCLQVANEDGLFLAGRGYIVTHNTKSEFASFLFPAWFLGKFPDKKVIQASHTAELAKDFGRNVRNLIGSEDYQRIFPGVELAPDNKAAGRWNTNRHGTYFAVGVDGAVAGKGADILVIDDPHNEQEATLGEWNPAVYDKVYKWYTSGPRQRLQPSGAIIVVMTRWSLRDLTGQIIDHAAENDALDEWEVIELPAILPSGNALWPEFWSLAALNDIKRDIPVSKWNAQYQQHPTSEEGALIKREWWRVWDRRMPECAAIIQSWDTAIEQTERANYSACTTWGIFEHPDATGRMQHNLILLDAERGKWEFPELKVKAKQLYQKYTPDQVIIERRASGAPLLFELRSMGIPVSAFSPTRGNDKIVRVNAVTDIFASGFVWAPPTAWAREVIEECAAFPAGKNDDLVDSTTQALLRFRQGGYIGTSGDDYDDEPEYRPVKKYY